MENRENCFGHESVTRMYSVIEYFSAESFNVKHSNLVVEIDVQTDLELPSVVK